MRWLHGRTKNQEISDDNVKKYFDQRMDEFDNRLTNLESELDNIMRTAPKSDKDDDSKN